MSKRGKSAIQGMKQKLEELGLTADVMARSLSLGFTMGIFPVYVPTIPTIICGAVARALRLSVPASIIGLNLATPFFLTLLVPFIRLGEWITRSEELALDGLMGAMKEDLVGAFKTFGSRLAMGAFSWGLAAPVVAVAAWAVFYPFCRLVATSKKT